MKTAHGLTNRRHGAAYGSVARHISDLSDPDANYFALLGGQDGWFGSSNFADQVTLWQRGEYVALPLLPASAAKKFRYHTVLLPGQSP
jgi:penicillin amidase